MGTRGCDILEVKVSRDSKAKKYPFFLAELFHDETSTSPGAGAGPRVNYFTTAAVAGYRQVPYAYHLNRGICTVRGFLSRAGGHCRRLFVIEVAIECVDVDLQQITLGKVLREFANNRLVRDVRDLKSIIPVEKLAIERVKYNFHSKVVNRIEPLVRV